MIRRTVPKRVRAELPKFLAELERTGIQQLSEVHCPTGELSDRAERLGIVSAYQSPTTDFPGSIYCTISLPSEQSGGFVSDTGDAFAHWVSGWLREPQRADNLRKLQRSGAGRETPVPASSRVYNSPLRGFRPSHKT